MMGIAGNVGGRYRAAMAAAALFLCLWLMSGCGGGQGPALDKDEMVSSLTEGRILYMKYEDYEQVRLSMDPERGHPQHVIDENWFLVGPGGSQGSGVGKLWDMGGNLLAYTGPNAEGHLIYTELDSGGQIQMTFETEEEGSGATLVAWVESLWSPVESWLDDSGYEYVADGELMGWASTIYERAYTSEWREPRGQRLDRMEFVKDSPALNNFSRLSIGDDGQETLLESQTLVEVRVLPEGAALPEVPDPGPGPYVPWPMESLESELLTE